MEIMLYSELNISHHFSICAAEVSTIFPIILNNTEFHVMLSL